MDAVRVVVTHTRQAAAEPAVLARAPARRARTRCRSRSGCSAPSGAAPTSRSTSTARSRSTFVVGQDAITSFVRGKSLLLDMFLAAECVGFVCPDPNQTCAKGQVCVDKERVPGRAAELRSASPRPDAATDGARRGEHRRERRRGRWRCRGKRRRCGRRSRRGRRWRRRERRRRWAGRRGGEGEAGPGRGAPTFGTFATRVSSLGPEPRRAVRPERRGLLQRDRRRLRRAQRLRRSGLPADDDLRPAAIGCGRHRRRRDGRLPEGLRGGQQRRDAVQLHGRPAARPAAAASARRRRRRRRARPRSRRTPRPPTARPRPTARTSSR